MAGMVDLYKPAIDSRELSITSQSFWNKSKLASVNQKIRRLLKELDNLNRELRVSKAREQAAIDLSIHWLMVELDSGFTVPNVFLLSQIIHL